jgi:hypothetical protein
MKLSGARDKYPATNVACIGRNVDRQHEPAGAKLMQHRLAPGRTPSFADQALPISETKPTLCDWAAFVHTIAMPLATFLNIYSRLPVVRSIRARRTLNW